ncbi:helix-turn-helix domain-containing protein [Vagococcus entomophilus]|uniref:Uncharacterized protein n=1 Tax=Vagococcus entomophilus TaxID=1160095 RepID=A0A430AFH5_9ENTE|nr:helix-turn-helix domain-containing protein [Vagococcus entomophilus]RSU06445.1 hypothetical protein CBF30_09325 [Vagococcus entomophilus]
MLNLFESHIKTQIEILNYVYSNHSTHIYRKDLATFFNISNLTMKKYLIQLFGFDEFHSINQTFFTKIDYNKVYQTIIQESVNISILKKIILFPGKSSDFYCEQLAISSPLFSKRIKELNLFLSNYHIQIKVRKGYRIVGQDEAQVIFFITSCFLVFSMPMEQATSQTQKMILFLKKYNCPTCFRTVGDFWEKNFFSTSFYVYLLRCSQGYFTNLKSDTSHYFIPDDDIYFLKQFFPRLTKSELCIALVLYKRTFSFNLSSDLLEKIKHIIKHFFLFSDEKMHDNTIKKMSIILALSVEFSYKYKLNILKDIPELHIFDQELSSNNPKFARTIRNLLKTIDSELDASTSNFFEFIFYWLFSEVGIETLVQKLNILLIVDTCIKSGHYIANKLSDLLNFSTIQHTIQVMDLHSFASHSTEKSHYDVLLSTVPLEETPVMLIPYNLTLHNSQNLIHFLADF